MRAAALAVAVIALGACDAGDVLSPSDAAEAHSADAAAGRLVVMTRNMYVGADVDAVIAALASPDPSDDLGALGAALQTLDRTDFEARATAMAGEIARNRPHFVALQEVSRIAVDLTSLGLPFQHQADFLPALLAELSALGLDYVAAGSVENIVAAPLPGVELRDYDVVLVDPARVSVLAAEGRTFTQNIGVVAPGVDIKRGYVKVTAAVAGEEVTVAGTHLEPGDGAGLALLRAAQAQELASALAGVGRAVVLGDLNDVAGSAMHQVLSGFGFTDLWTALRPGAAGLTCCHPYDLSGHVPEFSTRIDYVLTRGFETGGRSLGTIAILGDRPSDIVEGPYGGIWPSDHAGLVATLLEP